MIIRQEEPKDHNAVFKLVANAFKDEQYTDHKEQFLVDRLRKSAAFIPELSLVAEIDSEIIGYILLTKIHIKDNHSQETAALALAPVAVMKKHRGKGIGEKLIRRAHEIAKELKFTSIVLLGHANYYPKFGYQPTKKYGIKLPFDVPEENAILLELKTNALKNTSGTVTYPKELYE